MKYGKINGTTIKEAGNAFLNLFAVKKALPVEPVEKAEIDNAEKSEPVPMPVMPIKKTKTKKILPYIHAIPAPKKPLTVLKQKTLVR